MTVCRQIDLQGTVQGVGFRPFVYRQALRCGISGTVSNTGDGVRILAQGAPAQVERFLDILSSELPPLAEVIKRRVVTVPTTSFHGFDIVASSNGTGHCALVPPDVSVCPACLREVADPGNRRFGYPFINCTNCGPRYTIVDDVPYDRSRTTMRDFPMCDACRREYENPGDRRFHAQAICCADCGPRLELCEREGTLAEAPLSRARELLQAGAVVAVKGIGGYHLAVDAANNAAVQRLRRRKERGAKPFALMVRDVAAARRLCRVSPSEAHWLAGVIRPIVLLRKRPDHGLSRQIAPENRLFGVMLPYTPLHRLLLGNDFRALVMTSGNHGDRPIIIDDAAAARELSGVADAFLRHNRRILHRADDSILKIVDGRLQTWRRARGFVPVPIEKGTSTGAEWLATGGMLKDTVALTRGKSIFLSPHLGDVESVEAMDVFRETVSHLQALLGIRPARIACDLHPGYPTSRYAADPGRRATVFPVPHHEAHVAACQLEHDLTRTHVIGLALDGTGYGGDGRVRGGEIFAGRPERYRRIGHLAEVPMPGGEAAVREPWRMALSWLRHAIPAYRDLDLGCVRRHATVLPDLERMMARGINSPLTSSCGRLFDAVAAILGLIETATFEGEPAVRLEMTASEEPCAGYAVEVCERQGMLIMDPASIIRGVVEDCANGVEIPRVAARFHSSLARLLAEGVRQAARTWNVAAVVGGGGVFLNELMVRRLLQQLKQSGLRLFVPQRVPPGDGGISLGQIAVARCRSAAEEAGTK